MIGDAILYIKKLIKQNICIHNYKYDGRIDVYTDVLNFKKCTKCGKIRIIKQKGDNYELYQIYRSVGNPPWVRQN